ncbi:hypothetical protein ABIB90_008251 [Bradyrhizobium sp. JR4.1]
MQGYRSILLIQRSWIALKQRAALQHAARRMSGIAARLEALTRAISKGTASGVH